MHPFNWYFDSLLPITQYDLIGHKNQGPEFGLKLNEKFSRNYIFELRKPTILINLTKKVEAAVL